MGWDFRRSGTQADVVNDLIKDFPRTPETAWSNREQRTYLTGLDVQSTTLAHQRYGETLWVVSEVVKFDSEKEVERKRYITCFLLDGLGYKGLGEASHPYYYSCPLAFLDMVPVACEEWRELVREWHKQHPKATYTDK